MTTRDTTTALREPPFPLWLQKAMWWPMIVGVIAGILVLLTAAASTGDTGPTIFFVGIAVISWLAGNMLVVANLVVLVKGHQPVRVDIVKLVLMTLLVAVPDAVAVSAILE